MNADPSVLTPTPFFKGPNIRIPRIIPFQVGRGGLFTRGLRYDPPLSGPVVSLGILKFMRRCNATNHHSSKDD